MLIYAKAQPYNVCLASVMFSNGTIIISFTVHVHGIKIFMCGLLLFQPAIY